MTNNPLSRFEDHIQRLIEGGFARLFAGRLHPHEVLIKLAQVMEDEAKQDEHAINQAPTYYSVRLNPHDHQAILKAAPDIHDQLAHELISLAEVGDFSLQVRPLVQILSDNTVPPHHIQIKARHNLQEAQTSTQNMPLDHAAMGLHEAPEATLILQGDRHIPLRDPVVTIGRQRDNRIILEDPQASRHHAQLRLRFGRYVLFDLNSRDGTLVNGTRIHEATLQNGDVIQMADTKLIYVESLQSPRTGEETQAYPPLSPDDLDESSRVI